MNIKFSIGHYITVIGPAISETHLQQLSDEDADDLILKAALVSDSERKYLLDLVILLLSATGHEYQEALDRLDWTSLRERFELIAKERGLIGVSHLIESLSYSISGSEVADTQRKDFLDFLERDSAFSRENLRAEWRNAFSNPIGIHEDRHARMIGVRRIQIVKLPSFEPGATWDIRESGDTFYVYRSDISAHGMLINYTRLDYPSAQAATFLRKITKLKFKISPDFSSQGGVDGQKTEIAVFGDLQSGLRFCWWTQWPRNWKPLVDLTEKMIADLEGSQPATVDIDQMVEEIFQTESDINE